MSDTLAFISVFLYLKIENMYRVSIELYKHEWKFGRTRNTHSFFEFSQTFTSVCITR